MAAEDVVAISVILMVMGLGLFTLSYISTTASQTLVAAPVINESSSAVAAFTAMETLSNRFDYIFAFLMLGLILSIMILSWFVPSHPIFYIAYVIVMVLSVILSSVMSKMWDVFSTSARITTQLAKFPITDHVLTNMPLYIAIIGFVGLTVMFAKPYIVGGGEE